MARAWSCSLNLQRDNTRVNRDAYVRVHSTLARAEGESPMKFLRRLLIHALIRWKGQHSLHRYSASARGAVKVPSRKGLIYLNAGTRLGEIVHVAALPAGRRNWLLQRSVGHLKIITARWKIFFKCRRFNLGRRRFSPRGRITSNPSFRNPSSRVTSGKKTRRASARTIDRANLARV